MKPSLLPVTSLFLLAAAACSRPTEGLGPNGSSQSTGPTSPQGSTPGTSPSTPTPGFGQAGGEVTPMTPATSSNGPVMSPTGPGPTPTNGPVPVGPDGSTPVAPTSTDGMPVGPVGPTPTDVVPTPVAPMACVDENYVDPSAPGVTFDYASIEAPVEAALGTLTTMADKAAQMGGAVCADASGNAGYWNCNDRNVQFSTPDTPAIRGFKFRDGPRGLSQWEEQNNASRKATAFPVSIARAASFDIELEYRVGQAICTEALAAGWNNVLAPTVNLARHPLAGRAQESYGEDPFWSGKMGTAFVVGCQQYAQACAKHYVANEVEDGRTNIDMDFTGPGGMQNLRENYARPFEMIIKDADVACVMASYNKVNGLRATESQLILKDLLRTEWGFRGFVMTDWAAMNGNTGGTVSTANAVNAGLELEMPAALFFRNIPSEVDQGTIAPATVDQAVRNLLTQKYRFGWGPTSNSTYAGTAQNPDAASRYGNTSYLEHPDHIALAREVAVKGSVLLKNEAETLPITPEKYASVMVLAAPFPAGRVTNDSGATALNGESFLYGWEAEAGNWADAARLGDKGSSEVFPSYRVSPFQGLDDGKPAGITVSKSMTPADAANADIAVVVAALTSFDEGEEWQNAGDRSSMDLSDGQAEFIAQVIAANPNTVVVLEGGSPIAHGTWGAGAKAIMMAWYPGMEGGNAIADLLYGKANFSGRLPQSWPTDVAHAGPAGSGSPTFTFDYYHGYRLLDRDGIAPLYPFGYGLSYTSFEISSVSVPCSSVTPNSVVRLSVTITNTGAVEGDETVQVYIGYPNTTQRRPIKELKAVRTERGIPPGMSRTVEIPLPVKHWAYFDEALDDWVVEQVPHEIWVGQNAGSVTLAGTVPVAAQ